MREKHRSELIEIAKKDLIYMDESAFDLSIVKTHGYSKIGTRIYGNVTGNRRGKRITVISAYNNETKKLLAPAYFTGSTDTTVFNVWLDKVLLPQIKNKNKVIIMDNAAFHKSEETRILMEESDNRLLCLPPYSPDMNPIEKKWAHVKNMVKKVRNSYDDFEQCVSAVLKAMSEQYQSSSKMVSNVG